MPDNVALVLFEFVVSVNTSDFVNKKRVDGTVIQYFPNAGFNLFSLDVPIFIC